ncbi:MAG: hypothetical protein IJA23_02670 [Clostridia bacterium]|nr:hypothetical protein [Clostridia bacterium]
MIRKLPPIEQISKLGYFDLYKLRKSLKTRLADRERSLKDAETASVAIKSKFNPPKNALEFADIAFADGKVVELKSEIFVFNTYLDEVNKYLEPMLEQFKNVGQPGNE